MQAFVPKNRRPKFELCLSIIDLNNIPLVSGTSYVKWHLPSSTSAEHRGRTTKATIREHKAAWDYEKIIPVRLVIDRGGVLQDTEIHFEIVQEYASGSRGERILLGNVKLNLPEYVDAGAAGREDGDEGLRPGSGGGGGGGGGSTRGTGLGLVGGVGAASGMMGADKERGVTRRYLMQESKINSTLKVRITMKQLDGDRNYSCPPLKVARVFGGIAGIMTGEQGEPDDLGHMPSISSKTREIGELHDMYRQTLAASWAAQWGELPADQCIEDIFAGGDGWGKQRSEREHERTQASSAHHHGQGKRNGMGIGGNTQPDSDEDDGGRQGRNDGHQRWTSGQFGSSNRRGHARVTSKGVKSGDNMRSGSGMGGNETHTQSSSADERRSSTHRAKEYDELDVREDMRSWQISPAQP
ncbi:hypothetical protein MMC25_000709 [Agyrium rufum]|nr:hypothetical protein [Agyrium rufum]